MVFCRCCDIWECHVFCKEEGGGGGGVVVAADEDGSGGIEGDGC